MAKGSVVQQIKKRVRLRAKRPAFQGAWNKIERFILPVAQEHNRRGAFGHRAPNQAAVAARELARALYCKAAFTGDALTLSLPPKLDAMWHSLILETRDYERVCKALGANIAHTARTANDSVADKNERVDETLRVYEAVFNSAPEQEAQWVWERERDHPPYVSSPHVTVTTPTGRRYRIPMQGADTIRQIKLRIQARGGFPPDMCQLIFAGRSLADDHTLMHYNIQSGSVLHMVSNLRGC